MRRHRQEGFTRAERKAIEEERFLFTRISSREAHVTSSRTLDDWILSKQTGCVILYHRHPGNFTFHEHRRFRTIDDAIREIHSHDEYVIGNQRQRD